MPERPHSSLPATIAMLVFTTAMLIVGGLFWFKMNAFLWVLFVLLIIGMWGGSFYMRHSQQQAKEATAEAEDS